MKKWHVRVRTNGCDSYVRVKAPNFVEAAKKARRVAVKRHLEGPMAGHHLKGADPKDWEVIFVSLQP